MDEMSEPAFGSVSAKQIFASPAASAGRMASFCAGVPENTSASEPMAEMRIMSATAGDSRAMRSITCTQQCMDTSTPPNSSP